MTMRIGKKRISRKGVIKYVLLLSIMELLVLAGNVQAVVYQGNHREAVVSEEKGKSGVFGTVVDENGEPLPYVFVYVENTTAVTYTDAEGKFALKANKKAMLIFSSADRNDKTVQAEKGKEMKVIMPPKVRNLEHYDKMPVFPYGKVQEYISKQIKYPQEAQKLKIQGKVFVSFVVTSIGGIKDIKIARSVHPFLDKEAMRIVKNMPNWVPGMQRGRRVNVAYTIPVFFHL